MAESTETKSPPPESQKERWVKYGANVVLSVVAVVAIAVIVTYLAITRGGQIDTTLGNANTLKPQTVNLIQGNTQKLKIVSLYERLPSEDRSRQDFPGAVSDMLDQYRRKGKNIEIDSIDPVSEPAKVDQLIEQVKTQYGGEVKAYRAFLDEFPKTLEEIKKLTDAEIARLEKLPLEEIKEPGLQQTIFLTAATVQAFPTLLQESQDRIARENKQKIPNYKGVVDQVRNNLERMSESAAAVIGEFNRYKDDEKLPKSLRDYSAESVPRFEAIKKVSDDVLEKIKTLGDLKLEDLRQSLRQKNTILVMGEKEWRVLPFEQVWRAPQNLRGFDFESDEVPRLQFAGEQQVTTAILALTTQAKHKVVFVRPGGAPLTQAMFGGNSPFSVVADRLRQYNFQVLEKDLSGQWEMQARMQQIPMPPEPSDEEIKDAVWVVLSFAPEVGPQGPNPLGPKVAEHLSAGGSALLLFAPDADNLDDATKPFGIEVDTKVMAVHEAIKTEGARSAGTIDDILRLPFCFLVADYGDHPMVKPMRSLESLLIAMNVVKTSPAPGVTVTPILPLPKEPKSWGERNFRPLFEGETPQYDTTPPDSADVAPPLFAGAVAEKEKAGRLVAIGGLQPFADDVLRIPDPELRKQRVIAARFPGNSELFTNAVYWLSRMDTMIAISPTAMEVSRIEPMSDGALRLWRWGVMIVGLPLLVLVAAGLVYAGRRD